MPKQRTASGAKKCFFLTGSGRVKRKHAYKSHTLIRRSKKRKRNLTYTALVHPYNEHNAKETPNL